MMREQLVAIREGARAIEAMAGALLRALEAAKAPPVEAASPCSHPPERRREASRMGAPGAWICECGAEGGG